MRIVLGLFSRLIIISLIVSSLVACSEDKPSSNPPSPYIETLTFEIEKEARIAFENSSSSCEDPQDCPGYVGSLISFKKRSFNINLSGKAKPFAVDFCSQQLIAPNQVLTNRHCIPEGLQYEGASCVGKINLKYPKTSEYDAEDLHCSKVLKISEDYPGDNPARPDWAILELQKPASRPHAAPSLEGTPIGASLTVYPSYFTTSYYDLNEKETLRVGAGVIRKRSCKSTRKHFFSGLYIHPQSPLVTVVCDQDIIGGNSGSGIYDENQNLVALGSFAIFIDKPEIKYYGKKHKVKARLFGGTNLHCISHLNSSKSPFCKFTPDEKARQFAKTNPVLFAAAETAAKQQNENFYSEYVEWTSEVKTFYERFGESKKIEKLYKSVPKFFIDHVSDSINKVSRSKAPLCINPFAPENFSFDSPLFQPDTSKVKLNILGEVSVGVKFDGYRFDTSRSTEDPNIYKVSLTRMKSPLREEFIILKEALKDSKKKCNNAIKILDMVGTMIYCAEFRGIRQDLKDFTSNADPVLINNETALSEYSNIQENLDLPVCSLDQISDFFQ